MAPFDGKDFPAAELKSFSPALNLGVATLRSAETEATPPASLPMTAAELMATPEHMLAWLRGKPASEVVARDMSDPDDCIGTRFMSESGHPDINFGGTMFGPRDGRSDKRLPQWFHEAFDDLVFWSYKMTAAQAIAAIEKAGA